MGEGRTTAGGPNAVVTRSLAAALSRGRDTQGTTWQLFSESAEAARGAENKGSERVRDRAPMALVWAALAAATLGAWALLAGRVVPAFVLPPPMAVARAAYVHRARLAEHAAVTLSEVLVGFAIGLVLACVLGYALYRSRPLERMATPLVAASQAVPAVVFAPLLVYWLGTGPAVKVVIAALIVFFPMLIATVSGFRQIAPEYRDLMLSYSASSSLTLRKLEIPAALPYLLAGLKVSITLAVIGAEVGEFLGAERGLAVAVQIAKAQFNAPLMVAATLLLATMGLVLYGLMSLIESRLLAGRRPPH